MIEVEDTVIGIFVQGACAAHGASEGGIASRSDGAMAFSQILRVSSRENLR